DLAGMLLATEQLLERTPDPHSRTIPRVASILTSHVARLRQCQALDSCVRSYHSSSALLVC
ncbi:MAG TPA: hypothetical protein VFH33_05520, partial [Candidatus Krumholzibacteria bacterium]|nr:hypothetical protein [Candidatus Krumholzibacteria bacterium]